ncbi:Poly U binding splicing factor half pint [Echinococcus multilocularis]|uniref:Poly U binding splicing factor half pint n=1 Tax=Echinococcus multilocularis TaxID=6211 RepID=A0A068YAZ4_ECHMU|nr:Poly U binding splicing factor half pint [Echinococcus multilocularis]
MFNVDDLAYINAYRKSVTSNGTSETREPIIFGKDIKEVAPFTLIALSDEQKFAVERAKKYALEQSIQNAVRKQMSQLQSQDINNIKQTQALVLLSRIYVGSISFEIGEEEIRKAFSPYGPIKSISLSWDSALQKHKGFAFVEFEVPEAASLVLEQMNGFMIAGRGIKVGRPSNAPQTATLEAELRQDPSNKCRIYVAGVHPKLSEADIQTVFEAFGTVKSCILEPDVKFGQPEINHKGYGWIEFETEEAAIAAVTNMNGFEIAHTLLRVGRAITPKSVTSSSSSLPPSAAVAAAAASITARVSALENENASSSSHPQSAPVVGTSVSAPSGPSGFSSWGSGEHVPPPGVFVPSVASAAAPLSVAPPPPSAVPAPESQSATAGARWDEDDVAITMRPQDAGSKGIQDAYSPSAVSPVHPDDLSRVVLLENMVSAAEEVDAYLEEEVAEECRNFGEVLRVFVYVMTDSSAVRIFVNFDSHDAAVNAVQALNGRFFDGHQIVARLYPDEEFQMRKLDL